TTDLLFKYHIAKVTRDNPTLTASKVLADVIFKYGTSKQILTDNGTHLTAALVNSIVFM
ncbi:unnamed protein product, partial [Rotaria sp. Silwood2]